MQPEVFMKTAPLKPNVDFAELENTATNFKITHILILQLGGLRVCSGRWTELATDALVATIMFLTVTEFNFEIPSTAG
jgi:hypothetical protein